MSTSRRLQQSKSSKNVTITSDFEMFSHKMKKENSLKAINRHYTAKDIKEMANDFAHLSEPLLRKATFDDAIEEQIKLCRKEL